MTSPSSAIAQIREQWSEVIQAVVAASNGDADAAMQLAPFLDKMSQRDDWRALMAVLRRILSGERDPMQLLPGLDYTDALIVGDILRGLGVDVNTPPMVGKGPGEESASVHEDDDEGDMVTLDEFLAMVVQACRPGAPPALAEQMYNATRGMATQLNASPGIRELGHILNAILVGERAPDLAGLPPEFADKVRGILSAIG